MLQSFAARHLAGALCLACLAPSTLPAAENSAFNTALNTIVSGELQHHAEVLADDTFEGRESGSRGGRAAAGYIVSQLEKLGVQGAGTDGSFYQSFSNGGRNILARLPGSDPTLKAEIVLIGAHYDHVGYGNPTNSYGPTGFIHNGADDNASGTAGLLETIEAFTKLPSPPRRTLVFAFWDGEEKGLLGSKHFVSQPTVPLAAVKLYLNMDMIGRLRNNTVKVFGTRTGFGLRRLVSEQNHEGVLLDFDWEIKANSDHHPFYSRNIPYLMPHTDLHDDYHRPRDDAHKLNSLGMQQVTRLLFAMANHAANENQAPEFREAAHVEPQSGARSLETPGTNPAPRLGVTWENELEQQHGLRITSVVKETPAEKAGLAIGDRLMTFNGQSIASEGVLRRDVLAAAGAFELGVEREGMDQPLLITVTPAGNPVRLGISWREDAAEPGTLIVIVSVPGSPAEQAGIRVGDRIYGVSGQSFTGTEDFRRLALSLPSPLPLQVERNGQVHTVMLELAKPPVAE